MTVVGQATRDVAQNKLLYSVLMNLPEAGQWELEVTIKQGRSAASALGQLSVAAPRSFLHLLLAKPVPAMDRRHSIRHEPMVKEARCKSEKPKTLGGA